MFKYKGFPAFRVGDKVVTIDDDKMMVMGKKGNIEMSQIFFLRLVQQHDPDTMMFE